MKNIKVSLEYKVPSWNFCNYDTGRGVSKLVCRFCEQVKKGSFVCQLYDTPLNYDGTFVEKNRTCCKNTAGFGIEITEQEAPKVDPKEIIKQTIKMYDKAMQDLLNQGYPRQMAEALAKQYVLGD